MYVCPDSNSEDLDVPDPTDERYLSFRRNGDENHPFLVWPAEVDGRRVDVHISALALSDFTGQAVCDAAGLRSALRIHRDHLQDRANAPLTCGADEVVLDIGSLK
jgi:hypothetical protein